MKPTNYVLGFLFSESMARVLLVQKARPVWMKGKWNGIGGHVEPGEDIGAAMRREAEEEAGVTLDEVFWHVFGEMSFRRTGERVFMFCARDPGTEECIIAPTPEQETEPICFHDWNPWELCLPKMINLHWLVPMAAHYQFNPDEGPCRIEFP